MAPGAQDISVEVPFEVATPINLPASGQFTQVTILTLPSHGLLTTPAPGTTTVTYTPPRGFSGADSFRSRSTGPRRGRRKAPSPSPWAPRRPVAGPRAWRPSLNTPASLDLAPFITGSGVTGIAIAACPAHGTVARERHEGHLHAAQDYFGTDTFTYIGLRQRGHLRSPSWSR